MSFLTETIANDGVSSTTGGTAKNLKAKGSNNGNTVYYLDDGAELLNQKTVEVNVKVPKVKADAPGGFTQARNVLLIKDPLNLDNGNRTVNTGRCEFSFDPETTEAEKLVMREMMIQSIIKYSDFWYDQATS